MVLERQLYVRNAVNNMNILVVRYLILQLLLSYFPSVTRRRLAPKVMFVCACVLVREFRHFSF
jgi:hypothetical protein